MHVRRVRSQEDVERLRVLRNHSKRSMTRFRKNITRQQQQKWWEAEPRRAWLLVTKEDEALGFVYISRRGRCNWITLGVEKSHQGSGLGTLLYRSFRPCFAEILESNPASIRAAQKAGYQMISRDGNKVVMKG